jgi:hypothetical protein
MRQCRDLGIVLNCRLMDEAKVKRWVHELNNRLGMVLASAELMQLESLSPKALERAKVIEQKTLEVRQIVRDLAEHLLS